MSQQEPFQRGGTLGPLDDELPHHPNADEATLTASYHFCTFRRSTAVECHHRNHHELGRRQILQ